MRLGVARLAQARPTRAAAGFVEHFRAVVAESGVPGLQAG
jgi:hypothetical protein